MLKRWAFLAKPLSSRGKPVSFRAKPPSFGARQPAFLAWLATMAVSPALPPRAHAQHLRGAVRDSAANTPLTGAVVTVLDSAGISGSRAITDAAGRFPVSLTTRSARLRLLR